MRALNCPKPIAWSFSRLDTFEKCPKQLNEMSIIKMVSFEQSEAMRQGEVVHKLLEDRISNGKPLPAGYEHLERMVGPILQAASDGQMFTELAMAWDKEFKPVGYKDWTNAWLRVSYDFAFIRGKQMCIFDWKTGNPDFKELQLLLYAATAFLAFPEIEEVTSAYVWIKAGLVDSKVYKRTELGAMWDTILPRVQKLQDANALNIWPATPNKYCRWCAVAKAGRCEEGKGRR